MTNTILKALIIDDDKLNCKLIHNLLKKYCPDVLIAGTAYTVESAIEQIAHHKPNLLLLDIELHDKTAFEILNTIEPEQIEVVLITAHVKYAPQSFKYHVTDYLLKPIQITELVNAIRTCKKNLDQKSLPPVPVQDDINPKFIAVPNNEQVELIDITTIVRLESNNNYTTIYSSSNDPIVSSKSIKDYEQRLPSSLFFRVHNSHIVNLKCITKYIRSKNGSLILSDGSVVPISAGKKKELTDKILI